MTHRTSDYARRLHEGGFRVTPQRQLILDAICDSGGHASPDDVYAAIHTKAPAINRATVYRNLDFLTGVRLVTSTDMGQGSKVYEIACASPHHHLVCRECGQVTRIDHAMVKAFFAKIERECQFTVETDHLALFGLCRQCRDK
jgi:Fur family ferric uptake transcriptional regulator